MISIPAKIPWLAACGLTAALVYFAMRLVSHRRFYRHLPGPPHSLFWGHLKILGEYLKKMPPDSYMQAALTQMKQDYDLPDLFYLDLWPLGPRFIICSSPDAAAIPTTVTPFAQSHLVTQFFAGNIGTSFIEATNGPLWKELHQMLAPGLTPSAVKTYRDIYVEEALLLHDRLQHMAKVGSTVDMNTELGKYPFEVVSRIFFGERLNAQTTGSQIYEAVKEAADITGVLVASNNPITKWLATRKVKGILARVDRDIEILVRARYSVLQKQKVLPTRTNATSLLDRMLLAQAQSGQPISRRLMTLILENAKGFLAAGYGTTADTSSYMFMLLAAFPHVLQKLREEHDRVYDKDFNKTHQMLHRNPALIKDLEYTTAVIHETLRMFSIGMLVRQPPADLTSIEYKGKNYPVKDHVFGVAAHAIHYDPAVFDDVKNFKPERFLPDEPTFPRNGFRPFERGLRSCIGQNIAMDEMKIILVTIARWFDFELRDHQPVKAPRLSHTDLDTKIGIHAYQYSRFSAGPHGPVNMKVRLAPREE
ncbi:cytochrome P450 [Lasiosphaeris hirsuta]|uniref:Cytochrome P450 n=1 Tax=Lasiosphaeris hirsuta TaxID=260670 RepID=A0AA40DGH1_9PEZI|nr:cytochrome P450 [Lasiosphaeris hirsuta]